MLSMACSRSHKLPVEPSQARHKIEMSSSSSLLSLLFQHSPESHISQPHNYLARTTLIHASLPALEPGNIAHGQYLLISHRPKLYTSSPRYLSCQQGSWHGEALPLEPLDQSMSRKCRLVSKFHRRNTRLDIHSDRVDRRSRCRCLSSILRKRALDARGCIDQVI